MARQPCAAAGWAAPLAFATTSTSSTQLRKGQEHCPKASHHEFVMSMICNENQKAHHDNFCRELKRIAQLDAEDCIVLR
jgi:hypothetical protein